MATDAKPDQVEKLFEKTVSVGKNFGVIVIPLPDGGIVEVATFRRDGAYADGRRPTEVVFADRIEDAKRRDFTVNALFYDLRAGEILDYVGGREDLEKKILRVVGDPVERFREDKLRLLRAVRFSGQLDFEIEPETEKAVREYAGELRQVSRERIRDEIDKLLMAPSAARGFEALFRTGLTEAVFEDWAGFIFPLHPAIFGFQTDLPTHDLEVRRALLLYPALKKNAPDRQQEKLRAWKYGRSFVELMVWLMKNESALRTTSADPVSRLLSRALILQKFEIAKTPSSENPEIRLYSENERQWMNSLEVWTDERASRACAILDALNGPDVERDKALERRKLTLGQPDPNRAKADDLLRLSGGETLQGPRLGTELRRLNRELLLR